MSKAKLLIFSLCFWFLTFGFLSFPAFAQTTDLAALVSQLQKQIEALQTQIQELKAELGVQQASQSPTPVVGEDDEDIPEFTRSLSRGSSGVFASGVRAGNLFC